ncbi:hypothetical protein AAE02nite_29180 [Adhaeribacter aerolatus]|uniref:Uncharacterized protein n=1 Tax=Adhaeribacter aerolatus TaxID=670289 RepID=A0A512AZX1_9BACT|nr:hypothetical protein [Adhaeribacter aerolatus]GEO05254.1 hypothetical protein AAE02nite_29180 [Adhaeribacter aerolatus]
MKAIKYYISLVALTLVLSFTATETNAQCAMCRASVESNQNGDDKLANLGRGLNKGILYLMAIPYILVGTVGFLYYRNNRKQQ